MTNHYTTSCDRCGIVSENATTFFSVRDAMGTGTGHLCASCTLICLPNAPLDVRVAIREQVVR